MNATMMASTSYAVTGTVSQRLSARRALASAAPLAFRPLQNVVSRRSMPTVQARGTKDKQSFSSKIRGDKGYDKNAEAVSPLTSAFTRRREIWVGRLAMVGFAAECLAELLTGEGALGQIRLYTGASSGAVDTVILAIIVFNFVTALNPAGPTFSEENQRDVAKRPKGPTQDPNITPFTQPKKYFGITNFGFTKKNELFVGRWAMLGFAASLIGEKLTGRGPIGQIGLPLDLPLNPTYAGIGLVAWVSFTLFAAIGFGNLGQSEGDNEIY